MENTTIESEIKPLIHISDYAAREGISRRTANRYVQQGRITTEKVKGRTMIIDIPIAKRRIEPTQESPTVPDMPKPGHLARTPDSYLFRLGELTALARTRRAWQALAIVLIVILFVSSPAMVWLYMSWQNAEKALSTHLVIAGVSQLAPQHARVGDSGGSVDDLPISAPNTP